VKSLVFGAALLLCACGGGGSSSPLPVQTPVPGSFTATFTYSCTSTGCTSTSAPVAIATGSSVRLTNVTDVGCDGRLTDGAVQLTVVASGGAQIASFGSIDNGNGSSATYTSLSAGTWTISGSPAACFAALHGANGGGTQTVTGTVSAT
jgi:hypothetical protein